MSSLDFIRNHLSEEEFFKLKSSVSKSSESKINLGQFQFFIIRGRIFGDEIVSFISKEDIKINEKEVLHSPQVSYDDLRGIVSGYFQQSKLI